MLQNKKQSFALQFDSTSSLQRFQWTPQNAISFSYNSTGSSDISNKQKDSHVDSTDQEESLLEVSSAIDQVAIYGERFQVDFSREDSICSFLQEVERKKNLNEITKQSIKIVVLEKAVKQKEYLMHLLQNAYKKYQEVILKCILI